MKAIYETVKTPHKVGMVLTPNEGEMLDNPSVFRHGDAWYMIFIRFDGKGYETHLAKSDDLIRWQRLGCIFQRGAKGAWDASQADGWPSLADTRWDGPNTLNTFNGRYWMMYLGGAKDGYETDPLSTGVAWTDDPSAVKPWTRCAGNPVLQPSDPSARAFERATIYKHFTVEDPTRACGGRFVNFYNAADKVSHRETIGMAVSDDMLHWRRVGDDPVIANGDPKKHSISGDPMFRRIGDLWVMFYFGYQWRPGGAFDTFACSYDLKNWTKWDGEPLVKPSADFDRTHAHKPWVLKHNGVVYHYYCAVGSKGRGIALAASQLVGKDAKTGETVLWPSDKTALRAQPDSRIAPLPDGSMGVETGVKHSWPGVRLDILAGAYDISSFGRVAVAVSNTTDKAQVVRLNVKGRESSLALAPHATGDLCIDIYNKAWELDAPLALHGMRGKPSVARAGAQFDIFFRQQGEPAGFSVRRITASGTGMKTKVVLSAKTFLPFVDKYGQFMHDDWPGKIHNDDELAAARAAEDAWLRDHAASPIPETDKYGGWAGGPQLTATGFFRTEKVNGKWWLVDPEGRLFFSHGVDCVRTEAATGIGFRENYFSWLPKKDDPDFGMFWMVGGWPTARGFCKDPEHAPFYDFARANALRKYGPDWWQIHAERAHVRIRAWGLNTIGNWSDPGICGMHKTPYTVNFGTWGPFIKGSTGFRWGAKLRDPFAPAFAAGVRKSAAALAEKTGEDPWCVGWFVDNELGWGNDDYVIGRAVLRSPANQAAKLAAREMLERKYGAADRLDAAWGTRYGTWDAFLAATNVPDEKLCGPDLKDIHRAVAAKYFRTVRDAIKAVAPNRLYLGSRFAWGYDAVHEECARYSDVVSFNIYSRRPLHDLRPIAIDKPMIVGEFHFGALDRGMFHAGCVATRNQDERAQCYRDYVNACLDDPHFVGTHWFQWRDQALTGRRDGENYQIGFVTVTDTPYPELVKAARDIGATMYQRRWGANVP